MLTPAPRCEEWSVFVPSARHSSFSELRISAVDDRFYLIDAASGGKIPSDVPGHPYSFTLREAMEWLEARGDRSGLS